MDRKCIQACRPVLFNPRVYNTLCIRPSPLHSRRMRPQLHPHHPVSILILSSHLPLTCQQVLRINRQQPDSCTRCSRHHHLQHLRLARHCFSNCRRSIVRTVHRIHHHRHRHRCLLRLLHSVYHLCLPTTAVKLLAW